MLSDIVTTKELQAIVQENNNAQDVLFLKIRYSCYVLSVVDMAKEGIATEIWNDADDTSQLEQTKNYFDFLLQSEGVECKINYQRGFAYALEKQGRAIEQSSCQILENNLQKFLGLPIEKEFDDLARCGKILRAYADLYDSMTLVSSAEEDEEYPFRKKAGTVLRLAKSQSCQQIWHIYNALHVLLKTTPKDSSHIVIMWIKSCLMEYSDELMFDFGMWVHSQLIKACDQLLKTLPEPNFENVSENEKQMLRDIALANEIAEEKSKEDFMDGIPF